MPRGNRLAPCPAGFRSELSAKELTFPQINTVVTEVYRAPLLVLEGDQGGRGEEPASLGGRGEGRRGGGGKGLRTQGERGTPCLRWLLKLHLLYDINLILFYVDTINLHMIIALSILF